MNVDDEGLAEELFGWRRLLATYEEPVGVQKPIVDGHLPLAGSQIGRLGFAVSPQTGGCESDRDSPLRERLPGNEEHGGAPPPQPGDALRRPSGQVAGGRRLE